jgi:RNA polymerase sigma-70 factor (ECF subfamily)
MQLERVFDENRRFLWALSYRMTGNAADADDVVQETFIRTLKHPPANTDEPMRPWLVKVAVNLSRDLLRRRRRQSYIGLWLPSPFQTENNDIDLVASETEDVSTSADPSARYELLESVSFAFLLSLEALTPSQRAVLLLRDVFDLTVSETADALKISEQNVKTTHHRARRAMSEYEKRRIKQRRTILQRTERIVSQLVVFLRDHDTESAARFLSANIRSLSDGGGEYFAAKIPVVGREKVSLFLSNLFKGGEGLEVKSQFTEINATFAMWINVENPPTGVAPRVAMLFEPNEDDQIERIYFVLASGKLTHMPRALYQRKST